MCTQFVMPFASKTISKMYLESELADIHFTFPNDKDHTTKVPAHKVILASASPVFKAMFYGLTKAGDTIEITDSNANAFKEFLQIIYLPNVRLTIGNIKEIVCLADKYDMLDCFNATTIQRQLTNENMVFGYQLAITLNNFKLKEFCEKQICKFTKDVLKSGAFLQCSREVLENILQQNSLNCSEADLFHACISWAKLQCQKNGLVEPNSEDMKNQLGECFNLIKFAELFSLELPFLEISDDGKSIENHNMLKAQANLYQNLIQSHDGNASVQPAQPQAIKYTKKECTMCDSAAINSSNTSLNLYRKISIPSRNMTIRNFHLKIPSEFLSSVSTISAPMLATKILNKKKTYYAINLKFDVNAAEYLVD